MYEKIESEISESILYSTIFVMWTTFFSCSESEIDMTLNCVNIILFSKSHFITNYNNKEYKINVNKFAKMSSINKIPSMVNTSFR